MFVNYGKIYFFYRKFKYNWFHSSLYRLDFDHFAISPPEASNHICNTDQFLVSGGSPAPTICGTSHGDHSNVSNFFTQIIF